MHSIPRTTMLGMAGCLVAMVIAGIADRVVDRPVVVFCLAALALASVAWLISTATEWIGATAGTALTGVLQSTLGNLPELFVVLFALSSGQVVVAQYSIVGSIFANALLVLGLTIVVGSVRTHDGVMRFHPRLPNDTATLMLLAVFIIVLLGLSHFSGDHASRHIEGISIAGAVVLLVVYAFWLWGYLRTGSAPAEETAHGGTVPGLKVAIPILAVAGLGAALVSDWFVAALEPTIAQVGLTPAFAGLVIVAIAGNAVENATAVVLAGKGRADLAISVVKNSVAQITVFLFPALVLLSIPFATGLTFALPAVLIGALVITALAVWQITGDGEASTFEGVALIGLYVLLAVVAFFE